MPTNWDAYDDMTQDGQTSWLVHLYEATVVGIRENGLPYERIEQNPLVLNVRIPTLYDQAIVMRKRTMRPPGHNIPSGVLD